MRTDGRSGAISDFRIAALAARRHSGAMDFQLVPNIGLAPVTLGMTRDQLLAQVGPVTFSNPFSDKESISFLENDLRVTIDDGKVVEVSVCPPSDVAFEGRSLFAKRGHWKTLVAMEPRPLETVGFIILPSLGVAFTGLHDGDRAQFAVTMFAPGLFGDLSDATPFTA